MDTLNKIKVLLGMEETPQVEEATPQEMEEAKEQLRFEEAALEDGTIISADAFEVGNAVFIVVEEDQQPLPVGEYALADGSLLVVEEEGVIAEIKSADEEVEEEVEEVVEQSEEVVEQSSDDSKEAIIQAIGVMENLLQEFNALKEEFASIKEEAKENAVKVEEFEKVGEEIKPNPEGNVQSFKQEVDFNKLTAQEKVQYLIYKNK